VDGVALAEAENGVGELVWSREPFRDADTKDGNIVNCLLLEGTGICVLVGTTGFGFEKMIGACVAKAGTRSDGLVEGWLVGSSIGC